MIRVIFNTDLTDKSNLCYDHSYSRITRADRPFFICLSMLFIERFHLDDIARYYPRVLQHTQHINKTSHFVKIRLTHYKHTTAEPLMNDHNL